MRWFVGGVIAALVVIAFTALSIVNFVGGRSLQVVDNATTPEQLQAVYSGIHQQCSAVRTDFSHYQNDLAAQQSYEKTNAAVLNGTVHDTPLGDIRQGDMRLQAITQGDQDQLSQDASDYDTYVEDHTKGLATKWMTLLFQDNGLPQSIQPPVTAIDCGSGVWNPTVSVSRGQ